MVCGELFDEDEFYNEVVFVGFYINLFCEDFDWVVVFVVMGGYVFDWYDKYKWICRDKEGKYMVFNFMIV